MFRERYQRQGIIAMTQFSCDSHVDRCIHTDDQAYKLGSDEPWFSSDIRGSQGTSKSASIQFQRDQPKAVFDSIEKVLRLTCGAHK